MKNVYILWFLLIISSSYSQELTSIDAIVDKAISNSTASKKAFISLSYVNASGLTFKKSFLPEFSLSSTLPAILKSVTRVLTPDGKDVFVSRNQTFYDFRFNVTQREPLLGGDLTFSTFYNRIDLFGTNSSKTYFATPFTISYSNDDFLFNILKNQKALNGLKVEEGILAFNSTIEKLVYETVEAYFDLFVVSENLIKQQKELKEFETILNIAEKRYKIGSLNKGDLLSLKLGRIDLVSSIHSLSLQKSKATNELKNTLGNEKIVLPKHKELLERKLQIKISSEEALRKMMLNNKIHITYKREVFEKELDIKEQKSNNKLKASVSASFGLSNTALQFEESIRNLQDQQDFSISLAYKLFDFGKNKQEIQLIELQKQELAIDYEIGINAMKDQLVFNVDSYNNNIEKLDFIKQKVIITQDRYEYLRKRFSLGKVSINELNIAQKEHRQIEGEYLDTLKTIWLNFYSIRELTMFDFWNNTSISH